MSNELHDAARVTDWDCPIWWEQETGRRAVRLNPRLARAAAVLNSSSSLDWRNSRICLAVPAGKYDNSNGRQKASIGRKTSESSIYQPNEDINCSQLRLGLGALFGFHITHSELGIGPI